MKLNHQTRLTLVTTGVAAAILALVFMGMVGLSERWELRSDRHMLDSAISEVRGSIHTGKALDTQQFFAEYPSVSFTIFDAAGKATDRVGRLPVSPLTEFKLYSNPGNLFAAEGMNVEGKLIVAGMDWKLTEARLHRFSLILLFLWFFMVALVGVVSHYAAVATFRPLFRLTEQAASFSGSDLSGRLELSDDAEFGEFTTQLNSLLDRIEQTARREEEFASDAAHELRTPLAIMRARIEGVLLKERSGPDYRKSLDALLPEVDRLTRLVEMLLRSATATHEKAPVTNLSDVIEETASRWLDRFENEGVHLEVDAQDVYAQIWPEELQCVVDNFLGNALRVSPRGSSCRIVLESRNSRAVIRVADEGAGIPEELIGKVFDRFTRGESSRNRSSGGFGIGLAVCKSIVDTRGGEISVQNRKPGAEFKVELEAVRP